MKSTSWLPAVAAAGLIAVLAPTPASALPASGIATAVEKPSGIVQVRHGRRGGFRVHRGFRSYGYRAYRPRLAYRSYRYAYRPRIRPYIYFSVPYYYSSYGSSCYWLKRRALRTGSRYWWRRYNACRYGW
ncbi:MAG: hypothetical protein AB1749_04400 [Pseudomonadota bacterium]